MYIIALISICLGAVGQFLLKLGAAKLQVTGSIPAILLQFFRIPELLIGLVCFGSSFLLWVFVLRKMDLSVAYPMVSLSYIIVTFLAVYFLHETWNLPKLAGLLLIIFGVLLINLSSARG